MIKPVKNFLGLAGTLKPTKNADLGPVAARVAIEDNYSQTPNGIDF